MKSPAILLLCTVPLLGGCAYQSPKQERFQVSESVPANTSSASSESVKLTDAIPAQKSDTAKMQPVSLSDADKSETIAEAIERKIIRDANISLEVPSTTETQHKVTAIAEQHGGFVVTSESKQRDSVDPAKRTLDIKLVVRVPAIQFGPTLTEIKELASNVTQESVTGQDVTEEYIDLEARLKTQKALELQFLEIMKQAKKVGDALEVQRQTADVRTEIEKLEGRKRFLENRASLSTITVNLQAPAVIVVSTTGFGHSLREAVSDSIDLASGIVLFLVRFVIMLVPIFVFLILPLGLAGVYLVRRAKRVRLAQTLHATPTPE